MRKLISVLCFASAIWVVAGAAQQAAQDQDSIFITKYFPIHTPVH